MALANKITSKVLSLFNSFSTSKYFDLFKAIFLLRFDGLESKSVFVIKFACATLSLKISAVNLLNSWVSTYLSWLWSVSLFSISASLVL